MEIFNSVVRYLDNELQEDRLDMGSLTRSLTIKMSDAMASVNHKPEVAGHEEEKTESDSKLNNIEVELEEIAQGVRNNLNSIFQRGEKFDSLASKSE